MAKTNKKKVSKIKTKKKIWFKILASKNFGNKEIGETYLVSPEKAVGRTISVNLRELSGSPRDQNVYITFKITNVEGTTLKTTVVGYRLTPGYVKRVVRKNANKVDDYLTLTTKNGDDLIIKSLLVTRNKTQRSTLTHLRAELKKLLAEELNKSDFATFVGNLVNRRVQSGFKKRLGKIHPLKEVAVRVLSMKDQKKPASKPIEVVVKPAAEPEEKSVEEKAPSTESTE